MDPDRIGCWGHSSGAHLAALLGTTDENSGFEGDGGYPGVSSRVRAVVSVAGPNDATLWPANATEAIFGKEKSKDALLLRQASPLFRARAGNPPFLLIHGDEDKSVSFAISLAFKAALEKAGVPVQMLVVKGGDHCLNAPTPGAPAPQPDKQIVQATILHFFEETLKAPKS